MPTIQYISPVGGAVDAASSFAGGFTDQSNVQARQDLLQQEVDLRRQREKALMQAMEIEQQTAEEERLRAAELREAMSAGVGVLGDIKGGPDNMVQTEDQWYSGMEKRAHDVAAKIAAAGGDPSHYLNAVADYGTERAQESKRIADLEDFRRNRDSGVYAAKDNLGVPVAPEDDPNTALLDEIDNDLSTRGGEGAGRQKLDAFKLNQFERLLSTQQMQGAATLLQKFVADGQAKERPNQAAEWALAGVLSGNLKPEEVYKNLQKIGNNQIPVEAPNGDTYWTDFDSAPALQQYFLDTAKEQAAARLARDQADAAESNARAKAGGFSPRYGGSREGTGTMADQLKAYTEFIGMGMSPQEAGAAVYSFVNGGVSSTPFGQTQASGGAPDPNLVAAVVAGTRGMDPNDPATRERVKQIKAAWDKTGGKTPAATETTTNTEAAPTTGKAPPITTPPKPAEKPVEPKYGGLVAVLDDIGGDLPTTHAEYEALRSRLDKEIAANEDAAPHVLGIPIKTRNTRQSGAKQQRSTQRTDERLVAARRELDRYAKANGIFKNPNAKALVTDPRRGPSKPAIQRDERDEDEQ